MLHLLHKSLINTAKAFSNIKYLILALLFGFLFYIINFFISTFANIVSSFKESDFLEFVSFTFNLFLSFKGSILLSSFVSMVILSLLTGILVSLIFYKIEKRKKISQENSFLTGTGMFLGIFAPGCAACGLGLAAFFGLSASFATLPLKGLEISFLAGIILLIAILRFSYTLFDTVCPIDINIHQKVKGGQND